MEHQPHTKTKEDIPTHIRACCYKLIDMEGTMLAENSQKLEPVCPVVTVPYLREP